jgi:hemophore-related protein
MALPARPTRPLSSATLLAGGLVGAALFCGIPSAFANEDPALDPPNCTSADLEGVRAGVEAATSAYLFTHPDVNWFVTSLEGVPRDQVTAKMTAWMNQHPQAKMDMTGIRQPLVDIKNRCGAPQSP